MRDWVVALVALGVGGVPKKDACEGTRSKLMWGSGSNTRITETTEDSKFIIG